MGTTDSRSKKIYKKKKKVQKRILASTWMMYCSHKKLVGDLDDLPQHKDCHSRSTYWRGINACRKARMSCCRRSDVQWLTRLHSKTRIVHSYHAYLRSLQFQSTPYRHHLAMNSSWSFSHDQYHFLTITPLQPLTDNSLHCAKHSICDSSLRSTFIPEPPAANPTK